MAITYFIKTKDVNERYEIVEKLTNIGYEPFPSSDNNYVEHDYIVVCHNCWYNTTTEEVINNHLKYGSSRMIDCKGSVDLLIALASLNDKHDKFQWFIDKNENYLTLCLCKNFDDWFSYNVVPYLDKEKVWRSHFHKLGINELIELFNNKQLLNSIKIDSKYDSLNEAKEILTKLYKYKKENSYRTYAEYKEAPLMVLPHKFHELLHLMEVNQCKLKLRYFHTSLLHRYDILTWNYDETVKALFSADTSISEKRKKLHFIHNVLKIINKI